MHTTFYSKLKVIDQTYRQKWSDKDIPTLKSNTSRFTEC